MGVPLIFFKMFSVGGRGTPSILESVTGTVMLQSPDLSDLLTFKTEVGFCRTATVRTCSRTTVEEQIPHVTWLSQDCQDTSRLQLVVDTSPRHV